ncbi:sigma-54-dependent transcriptional regulator [Pelovirga terrestris]|uniref:Sigma-54-dependent Fis family transcriptional regulator n=1 Tax=Pelovirga terrestris TaxID=2771352 RepID=A0A8J6QM65_9BACT|nr:sigma-54 dependent transcriptional regulator [Pelovirga terrestris]MBD1399847.1 sigma-54-dependent Fis family transcriptional regulator [Pelovirga terrestris]
MAGVRGRVLFVDDDASTRKAMTRGLRQDGFEVTTAASAEEALTLTLGAPLDVLVTDVLMGGMSGIGLLRKVRQIRPGLPVVVITGYGSVNVAVEAMREGAADYFAKPVSFDHLARTLDRVIGNCRRHGEIVSPVPPAESPLIGQSDPIRKVLQRVAVVAGTDATVLVRGESGTGKELVSRQLHRASRRRTGPLVIVNCAAITESLAESELFGHEKGAFTGAVRPRAGKIEQANGGTLFLDEIGDLSPIIQTKILRVLQDQIVERVGGSTSLKVDVRLVAATNRDLERMIQEGGFREDLYYRLKVVTIDIPPLRDRIDDISPLVNHFLEELAHRYELPAAPALGRGVMDALRAHPWPGNVRELRNLIEELVITGAGERILLVDLPHHVRGPSVPSSDEPLLDGTHGLDEIERAAIQRTLTRTGGNKTETARILGIGLKTLYRKLGAE